MFILVIIIGFGALVAGTMRHKASLTPGLALDLEGGTQIILTPTTSDGSAISDEDELVAALRGCDVAFSHTFPFTRKVIEACPDLKMIAICRGGPVNVNIEAASDHGVLVSYAPGRNAVATAEHSVGMILAAMRQIPQRNAELLAGQWRSDYYIFDNVGLEVGSSTVGVIGYGAVGRRVAHIMASFGGDVLVHDPWAADRSGEGVAFVDTLEVVERVSDELADELAALLG